MLSINAIKPANYSICFAAEDDVNALAELETMVFNVADGMISKRAFCYHIQRRKNLLLVVKTKETHAQLVAYILVFIHKYSARIFSLAIHPKFQKQGIAKLLLKKSMEEIQEKGIKKITLELRKKIRLHFSYIPLLGLRSLICVRIIIRVRTMPFLWRGNQQPNKHV